MSESGEQDYTKVELSPNEFRLVLEDAKLDSSRQVSDVLDVIIERVNEIDSEATSKVILVPGELLAPFTEEIDEIFETRRSNQSARDYKQERLASLFDAHLLIGFRLSDIISTPSIDDPVTL